MEIDFCPDIAIIIPAIVAPIHPTRLIPKENFRTKLYYFFFNIFLAGKLLSYYFLTPETMSLTL